MKLFILFSLLLTNLSANEIDLGQLEIQGEVRRPMVDFVDTDIAAKRAAQKIGQKMVMEFELMGLQEQQGPAAHQEAQDAYMNLMVFEQELIEQKAGIQ